MGSRQQRLSPFFHQETGIHILGDSVSHLVRKGKFVICYICFETIVPDILREGVY